METHILSGKELRDSKAEELKKKIEGFARKPCLAILQVGDKAESNAYIAQKKLFGARIGCDVRHIRLDESASDEDAIAEIGSLKNNRGIDGIIVQLPLPPHADAGRIIEAVNPDKDVDGLTAASVKRLWQGDLSGFVPATAKGVLSLLAHYGYSVEGKRAVVVGRSSLVGKPLALSLLASGATVTIAHRKTADLAAVTQACEFLFVATGKRGLIAKNHVARGQVVIDIGINPEESEDGARKLYGDVDAGAVAGIAAALSPVPGGVGPLTVASLFENVVLACERFAQ